MTSTVRRLPPSLALDPTSLAAAAVAGSESPEKIIGPSMSAETPTTPNPSQNVNDMSPSSVTADVPDPDHPTPPGSGELVSPDPGDVAEVGRRRRWPWAVGVFLAAVVAAAFLVPTPYYLIEPGSVRPTAPRIRIEGHPSFESKSNVLFTTVSLEHATVAALVRGWIDDAVDIKSEHDLYPEGRSSDQVQNQELMDQSKVDATVAALHEVGYPAEVTGTGVFVAELLDGFPAAKVLHQGEVLLSVDGAPTTNTDQLQAALAGRPVGAQVTLVVQGAEGGPKRTETVELGRNKDDLSRGYLGIRPETFQRGLNTPFHVEIDSGKVIGPSAGLAWTLGIIDRLTPGDLAGKRDVAVTGTIDAAGHVGAIGEAARKVATAKRAGVKVFIYPVDTPPAEVRAVKQIAGHDVELHQVSTLDQAVHVLAPEGLPAAPPLG